MFPPQIYDKFLTKTNKNFAYQYINQAGVLPITAKPPQNITALFF